MHCGETDDEAMREGGGGADWYVRASNLLYSIWADPSSKSYAWYAEQFANGRGGDTEDVNVQKMADEGIICLGGPEKCAQVVRYYEEQGIDQIIFLVQAGGTPDDAIQRSLRLFGEKVIPQFK